MPARVHTVEPPSAVVPALGAPALVQQPGARVAGVGGDVFNRVQRLRAHRRIAQAKRGLQHRLGHGQAVGPADREDAVVIIAAVRLLQHNAAVAVLAGQPAVAGDGPGNVGGCLAQRRAFARRLVPAEVDGLDRVVDRARFGGGQVVHGQLVGKALARPQRQAVVGAERRALADIVRLHKQPGRVFIADRVPQRTLFQRAGKPGIAAQRSVNARLPQPPPVLGVYKIRPGAQPVQPPAVQRERRRVGKPVAAHHPKGRSRELRRAAAQAGEAVVHAQRRFAAVAAVQEAGQEEARFFVREGELGQHDALPRRVAFVAQRHGVQRRVGQRARAAGLCKRPVQAGLGQRAVAFILAAHAAAQMQGNGH